MRPGGILYFNPENTPLFSVRMKFASQDLGEQKLAATCYVWNKQFVHVSREANVDVSQKPYVMETHRKLISRTFALFSGLNVTLHPPS